MSPAARAKALKASGQRFDFAARRAMLQAAEAARAADPADAAASEGEGALTDAAPPAPTPRVLSPGQASALKKAASAAADALPDGSADLTPYEQQLVRLHTDLKRLKTIQSTEKKIAIKRELLPDYLPWVLGKLSAAAEGKKGVQDDVLVQVMIWAIDVADYRLALELAEYCWLYSPAMPQRFKRDLPNTVTEEIADAALKAYRAGGDEAAAFPAAVLGDLHDLFEGVDMFDVVRAKLEKALGQAIMTAVSDDEPEASRRVHWTAALAYLKRAQGRDAAAGCVKLIEKLEREIAKIPEAAS